MKLREPYRNIDYTLKMLMVQVYDSFPYAFDNCPEASSPERLFNILKQLTVYRNDPPGVELLQTMQTLFENNRHGIPGAGDCDCFTILSIAFLRVNGFNKLAIVLRGRNSHTPVHIYPAVKEGSKWLAFDLTNTYYGNERPYPYRQTLVI